MAQLPDPNVGDFRGTRLNFDEIRKLMDLLQRVDAAANIGSLRSIGTGALQAASGTVDAAAGVGSVRTLGAGALQAAPGNQLTSNLKRGVNSITITNGTEGGVSGIGHGFASAPTVIVATARVTADTRNDWVVNIGARGPTTFNATMRAAAAEQFPVGNPATVTFDWIAFL